MHWIRIQNKEAVLKRRERVTSHDCPLLICPFYSNTPLDFLTFPGEEDKKKSAPDYCVTERLLGTRGHASSCGIRESVGRVLARARVCFHFLVAHLSHLARRTREGARAGLLKHRCVIWAAVVQ